MKKVMVQCLFSILILLIVSDAFGIRVQDRQSIQWSDQQAEDWQPFIPNFAPQERPYQQYPRSDTVRQFFGKNVEAVHNSLKKSFQTSAANNIDQFAVPPALNSFNTFGLQTIQTRPAILDKNVKDSQYLEQSPHFSLVKFQQPQPLQQSQPSTVHRFPAYIPPPAPQYQTINQFQHYQPQNQFSNRFENGAKQSTFLQAPARTISTSVQVFPPNQNQQNAHVNNAAAAFFLPPPNTDNFIDEEPVLKKQSRPNDFLVSNNIPTIYGNKDPTLNIAPPSLKTAPFLRPEIQNHFLYEPVKATLPERFEIVNHYQKQGHHEVLPAIKHVEHKNVEEQLNPTKQILFEQINAAKQTFEYLNPGKQAYDLLSPGKQVFDQSNPSKQVYEQLSHYGRPFTLPKESVTEFNKFKLEKNVEPEGLIHSYSPPVSHLHPHHHNQKKEKQKPNHHYMPLKNIGRVPVNSVYNDPKYPSNSENHLIDYEPGKLHSVKTVTYTPERDVFHFNEGDVSGYPYQTSEKLINITPSPFLPTPTESADDGPALVHYEKYTTPSEEIVSKLPQNHKYSGSRHRYHSYSHTTEPSVQYFDDRQPSTSTDQPTAVENIDDQFQQQLNYELSTRKATTIRRRKPSKSKNKDYTRQKVTVYTDATPAADIYPTADAVTNANYLVTRKKSATKHTTTEASAAEENYPNFENFQAALKQHTTNNHPKEYQPYDQYDAPQVKYSTEDPPIRGYTTEAHENYPPGYSVSAATRFAESTTLATASTVPSSSSRPRIKPKYGNSTRPRFSIKEYKRTTTVTPSTAIAGGSSTENVALPNFESEKKNNRKQLFALRVKNRTESTTNMEKEETSTAGDALRRYKPRTRPSKYRISTTAAPAETTTERVNTFKPSTAARYRPSSPNKYFNRIRTTTELATNDADDAATSASDRKPVRTQLYSAKRSSILKTKSSTTTSQPKLEYEDDDDGDDEEYSENETEEATSPVSNFKKNFQRYKTQSIATKPLEKADDESETSIMTSSEEDTEKEKLQNEKKTVKADIVYPTNGDSADSLASGPSAVDDDLQYRDEVLELERGDNESTTAAGLSSTTANLSAIVAEERIDDEDEKVSKVSSLTSIVDNSRIPASFYRKWSSTSNQNE